MVRVQEETVVINSFKYQRRREEFATALIPKSSCSCYALIWSWPSLSVVEYICIALTFSGKCLEEFCMSSQWSLDFVNLHRLTVTSTGQAGSQARVCVAGL